jgi:hypothetical protein
LGRRACGSITKEFLKFKKKIQADVAGERPSPIYRAKITVLGTKQFMDVRYSSTQIFDIYQFHVRWAEPLRWNDETVTTGWEIFKANIYFFEIFIFFKIAGKNRHYDLHCWVRDRENGDEKVLFSAQVDPTFNGYHEKLRFPPDRDFVLQCEVCFRLRLLSQ